MSGGAWKVAYADFVTAMMALFMVLWILGAEQDILMELQDYFRNPPSPWDSETSKYLIETGDHMGFSAEDEAREDYFNSPDPAILQGIVDEFNKLLESDMNDVPPPVKMTLTSDGLRMVVFDRDDSPMFLPRGVDLTDWGMFLLQNLAWLLSRYEFEVTIESHCEPDMLLEQNYGPWELTTDRSNKIRRELQHYAGGEVGIGRVSGYGATQPVEMDASDSSDFPPINQRVIISMNLPDPSRPLMEDSQAADLQDAEAAKQSNDLQNITQPVL